MGNKGLYIILFMCFVVLSDMVWSEEKLSTISDSHSRNKLLESCKKSGFLLVGTVDGVLTALNLDSGEKCWRTAIDAKGFMSSSLSKLEVLENGYSIRLVPSLDGALFKFDQVKLQPLHVNSDMLLKSSSKFDETTSFIGGKYKNVYGIHYETGQIRYKCTSKGCEHFQAMLPKDDILVVEENIQSVSAVNSLRGVNQWHFRVVELDISMASDFRRTSFSLHSENNSAITKHHATSSEEMNDEIRSLLNRVKVSLTNGYIGVHDIHKNSNSQFAWLYKLNTPVVEVWLVKGRTVHLIDLFEDKSQFFSYEVGNYLAYLFLGNYKNQLFIKQSHIMKLKVTSLSSRTPKEIMHQAYTLPAEKTRPTNHFYDNTASNALMSVSVLPSFEFGMYFYVNFSVVENSTHCLLNNSGITFINHSDVDFWLQFGATVASVMITSCFICLYFYRKMNFAHPSNLSAELNDEICLNLTNKLQYEYKQYEYTSRFLQDFDLTALLGRGGFGIVMEARNKIDDCSYAIKRIRIDNELMREKEHQKVMREVKALAMLEHPGIVRYFNAWIETPPVGWQEHKDLELNICDTSSTPSLSLSQDSPSEKYSRLKESIFKHNPLRPFGTDDFIDGNFSEKSKHHVSRLSALISDSSKDTFDTTMSQTDDISNSEKQHFQPIYLYIQMQLCQKESLREWLIRNCKIRKREEVFIIFCQIVDAVEYVHERGLMHRDLKPSNIFFSLEGVVKIGDFGLVTTVADVQKSSHGNNEHNEVHSLKHTSDIGTDLYMSPEQRLKQNYNNKTDIFSLGIIFFEMLVPFSTVMERYKVMKYARHSQFPKSFIQTYPNEVQFVSQMLSERPDDRPSALEIKHTLCQPYFKHNTDEI